MVFADAFPAFILHAGIKSRQDKLPLRQMRDQRQQRVDPGGVGRARDPQVYLQPGDEVSVSIDGIGTISNRIVDAG